MSTIYFEALDESNFEYVLLLDAIYNIKLFKPKKVSRIKSKLVPLVHYCIMHNKDDIIILNIPENVETEYEEKAKELTNLYRLSKL